MKFKNFLSAGLLCCFCGASMPLLGMNSEQKTTPAASVVKLVLSKRLYKQQANSCIKFASSVQEAYELFSQIMGAFEMMQSELKCYLKDEDLDFVDKEVTQGLTGVSKKEFVKKSDVVSLETKIAYKKAVDEKCGKILNKILVRAALGLTKD